MKASRYFLRKLSDIFDVKFIPSIRYDGKQMSKPNNSAAVKATRYFSHKSLNVNLVLRPPYISGVKKSRYFSCENYERYLL